MSYSVIFLFAYKPLGIKIILFFSILIIGVNLKVNINNIHLITSIPFFLFFVILSSKLLSNKENKAVFNKIIWCLLALNLILLFQLCTFNLFSMDLFYRNLQIFSGILLIVIIFYKYGSYVEENYILKLISFLSLFNSILAFLQYLTGKTLLLFAKDVSITYTEGIVDVKRVVGLVGVNNGAGNLGAIFFPVLLYMFLKNKNTYNLIVLVLNVIFTFLTLTRAGILAITIEFIIYIFYIIIRGKMDIVKKMIMIIAMGIVFFVCYQLFNEDLYRLLFTERGDTTASRTAQFSIISDIVSDNILFGIGAGNYLDFVWYRYGIKDTVLHSQWLNIIIEQGIVSFFIYLVFNLILLLQVIKRCKEEYLWFPIALFIGNAVTINFNPNQYYELNIFIFYIIVFGMIFSKSQDVSQK